MDPVEKMLIEKYNINPEEARVMAYDMKTNAFTKGQNAPVYKDAKEEAYTDVANGEISRLERMAKNARAFSDIHARMAKGESLTPEEEQWYEQVKTLNRNRYIDATSKADTERTMGFVKRDVQAKMAADRVPGQIDKINNGIDTAMATQQTARDHIVNQLIPQPTNMTLQPVQPQQGFPTYTPQGSNMDPAIAACIAQMQRGQR